MVQPVDIYRAYNFKLDTRDGTEGHFTECTGLGMRVTPIKYREGGNHQVVHSIPGRVDYAEVTLRYGLTSSTNLWDWFMKIISGVVERRDVSIIMLDSQGSSEVMRWNLNGAWPCEWRGAPLDAIGHEVAIESLTLSFETLVRA